MALFFICSCEKVIEFESEEVKPKLVIDGQFETDSTWKVRISHSQSVLEDEEIDPITNAVVTISDINGNLIATLDHTTDGEYISAGIAPSPGNYYRLDASASGYDAVYAESSTPSFVPVISYDTSTVTFNNYDQKKCVIRFQDPPAQGDRYIIYAFSIQTYIMYDAFGNVYDTLYQLGHSYITSASPHVVNADSESYQEKLFLTDQLMNGNEVEVDFYIPGYYAPDFSFGFALMHVSEDYFRFTQTSDTYLQSAHDPFSQPVLVYSNIINGRGIFAGFSRAIIMF